MPTAAMRTWIRTLPTRPRRPRPRARSLSPGLAGRQCRGQVSSREGSPADLLWRQPVGIAFLANDAPTPKTEHPICHAGNSSIVGNYDCRGSQFFVGALDGGKNNLAGFVVESTCRLVTK